jgi:hypothetical protein
VSDTEVAQSRVPSFAATRRRSLTYPHSIRVVSKDSFYSTWKFIPSSSLSPQQSRNNGTATVCHHRHRRRSPVRITNHSCRRPAGGYVPNAAFHASVRSRTQCRTYTVRATWSHLQYRPVLSLPICVRNEQPYKCATTGVRSRDRQHITTQGGMISGSLRNPALKRNDID